MTSYFYVICDRGFLMLVVVVGWFWLFLGCDKQASALIVVISALRLLQGR